MCQIIHLYKVRKFESGAGYAITYFYRWWT
jgi:hypothetical protein